MAASARVTAASTAAYSLQLWPVSRYVASTPSASAIHSSVAAVGRVLPRSIWEMYSFEQRSAASSSWVRPAAARSCRTRAPNVEGERRAPVDADGVRVRTFMLRPSGYRRPTGGDG